MNAGYPVEGMELNIEVTKGRKGNGTYATIDFVPLGTKRKKKVEVLPPEEEEEDVVKVEAVPVVEEAASEEEEEGKENAEPEEVEKTPEVVVSPKKSLFG